ncbi:MAG: enoyl-CoA hydratase/isomerase family protein [Blastocatellia bacterium]|nr:enoyl-CoA hydratase/isomerase family protein [Blastocatellia bacterium]
MFNFSINSSEGLVVKPIELDQLTGITEKDVLAVFINSESIKFEELLSVTFAPLIFASPTTTFRFTTDEPIDTTGLYHLTRRIGTARVMELMLLQQDISSQQALSLGLVNDTLTLQEFKQKMADIDNLSFTAIRLAIDVAERASRLSKEQAETIEKYAFALRFSHPDQREGMSAFINKRTPVFHKSSTP